MAEHSFGERRVDRDEGGPRIRVGVRLGFGSAGGRGFQTAILRVRRCHERREQRGDGGRREAHEKRADWGRKRVVSGHAQEVFTDVRACTFAAGGGTNQDLSTGAYPSIARMKP
ncbi:hypothetical protein LBMAG42_41080 [Deltaproteobacteria bacterium]|nr:hypothetical protein LBMAG42_41080 [Deltaproteobacteria bacterium]